MFAIGAHTAHCTLGGCDRRNVLVNVRLVGAIGSVVAEVAKGKAAVGAWPGWWLCSLALKGLGKGSGTESST